MDKRLKHKTWYHRNPRRKSRQNYSGHRSKQGLHDQNTKSIDNKSQNRQMGPNHTPQLLHGERKSLEGIGNQQNGKKFLQFTHLTKG